MLNNQQNDATFSEQHPIWFFERMKGAKGKHSSEPLEWDAFSTHDSQLLESRWIMLQAEQVAFNSPDPMAAGSVVAVGCGQLWQVDVGRMLMVPVYWSNEQFRVRRSLWHHKPYASDSFHPLETEVSHLVELAHSEFVAASLLAAEGTASSAQDSAAPDNFVRELPQYASNQFAVFVPGHENVAWLQHSRPAAKAQRSFFSKAFPGQKIFRLNTGLTTSPAKSLLLYGEQPAIPTQQPATTVSKGTINHLLLCVHGIGQKFFEKMDAIFARDIEILRLSCLENARKRGEPCDFQILPIQWRLNVNLSGTADPADANEFDASLRRIALPSITSVRSLMSDVALDILLYMSPAHYEEIVNKLVAEMNQVYELFVRNNPQFSGRVSILAHSLGSVLAFDLLASTYAGQSASGRLGFKVNQFFALGSPLSVFLLIKGINLMGTRRAAKRQPGHRPSSLLTRDVFLDCNEFYNVFHPNDPCAFRMEPLLVPEAAAQPPFSARQISSKKPRNPAPARSADTIAKITESLRSMFYSSTTGDHTAVLRDDDALQKDTSTAVPAAVVNAEPSDTSQTSLISDSDSDRFRFASFNELGRIDFVLSERMLEYSYFSMLSAHSQYWKDKETCRFIISRLHSDEPSVD